MRHGLQLLRSLLLLAVAWGLSSFALRAQAGERSAPPPPVGPGSVVVHTALGGFILGYDIDATGDEGILSEARTNADGTYDVAVETFSQKTGKILKIVKKQLNSTNDYSTLGIFGSAVALTVYEKSKDIFVDKRIYELTDPVDAHTFTGQWTPPFNSSADHIISGAAYSQGFDTAVFMGFINDAQDGHTYLFSSNVGANTFGPLIQVTNDDFDWSQSPVLAVNETKNQAVLGGGLGCFGCLTFLNQVDLVTGEENVTPAPGRGFVNGIAVDSGKQIASSTTEDDFSVEFYDLVKGTSIIEVLPGATSQINSGGAVANDPIHHLFLVGQEFSSTAPSGSSIHVYDVKGNLVESLNGFSLPASPAYMALNPSKRTGFVIVTPNLTSLQSFTY
jgi:hypothetical protein